MDYLVPAWKQTACQMDENVEDAMQDSDSVGLYEAYHYDEDIKHKGTEVIDVKWGQDIVPSVEALQKWLIGVVESKQISIECNLTSNCKIGHFKRYDEHPILLFDSIEKDVDVPRISTSINTDDRGVFVTSIGREYALLWLALEKVKDEKGQSKYNRETISSYLEELQQNGKQQCFKVG